MAALPFALRHFQRLARYNAWANQRLYAACRKLPEAEYLKTRQAFFKSIHGTLNHILVVDRLWFSRLQGTTHGIRALDQELYAEFIGLHVARQAEDALIISHVDGLDERDLERVVHFNALAGDRHAFTVEVILTHMFNHQTHHRGQAHALLSQTAVEPPSLDFAPFVRESR